MRVSKNTYYHWINNKDILKVKSTTTILKERIEAIFIKNRQIYGSHRIPLFGLKRTLQYNRLGFTAIVNTFTITRNSMD